ncbi:PadR family transcriptional regulator [Sediminibacillus albus]|uniref:PadR family transcriptional regulator, regulatory protein PadR n=1 Tax=Sediminibacillus albus TaxID=407036 RepID=A0A1G9BDA9_9BACI|nr:PadR family transcriptional regulator [Sediminibacillus albus]SDK37467.1 PadR family transcriptional regulator, regulatory protein PadR [Sediminibacillus albus]
MIEKTQLLKGVLEGAILGIISEKETYGYKLLDKLKQNGFLIGDGSIYPLLLRMEKKELIKGEMRPSSDGPNRKYYSLTEKGEQSLLEFKHFWDSVNKAVKKSIYTKDDDYKNETIS